MCTHLKYPKKCQMKVYYNEMRYEVIVVPPPSVCAVLAKGSEARKGNLSIVSNPVSLMKCTDGTDVSSPTL